MNNKKWVSLFSTMITSVVIVGCGSDNSDFSQGVEQATSASVTTDETEAVLDPVNSVEKIKVGQICDVSAYALVGSAGYDFKFATQNVELRVYTKHLKALVEDNTRDRLSALLAASSNLIQRIRYNSDQDFAFNQALVSEIDEQPVCVIKHPQLLSDLKKGAISLKALLQQQCGNLAVHKIADDAKTEEQKNIMSAIQKFLKDPYVLSHRKTKLIENLIPNKIVIAEGDRVFTSIDMRIVRDESRQLQPVISQKLLDAANEHWEGYLAFMHTTASDKRCDYERLKAAN